MTDDLHKTNEIPTHRGTTMSGKHSKVCKRFQVNRFDKAAESWDEKPQRVELAGKIAQAITDELPLDPKMDALEYGCGTGLVTLALAPLVSRMTAVDSSTAMLEVLGRKCEQKKITNVTTRHADFAVAPLPDRCFDLLVCAMTLHHVEDVPGLVEKFSRLVTPGGFIALADLDREDGSFHDDNQGVAHYGIKRDRLLDMLKGAGFTKSRALTAHTIIKNGREYPIFLAVAQRRHLAP